MRFCGKLWLRPPLRRRITSSTSCTSCFTTATNHHHHVTNQTITTTDIPSSIALSNVICRSSNPTTRSFESRRPAHSIRRLSTLAAPHWSTSAVLCHTRLANVIHHHLPHPHHQQIATRTMASTAGSDNFVLNKDNVNQNAVRMEYAVRGPIVIRAGEIEKELQAGNSNRSFNRVIRANIGDCHATGQKPLTFLRQVVACAADNSLLDSPNMPSDVRQRTRQLLAACGGGSAGSYSDSAGIELIRRHVAEYIERRDNYPANWQDVVLTGGASEGIRAVLSLVNKHEAGEKPVGVMISIPQYPLYSATIAEYGMHQINYYLDEDKEWSLDINELKRSLNEARPHCVPRVLAVINPGNPTGSVLTRENIRQIVRFAHEERLLIIADEVYQQNVWAEGAEFHSFKSVMRELGIQHELASMMSISKGFMGECGLRGGYCELVDVDPAVKAIFLKMLSARLCCSVLGQVALDCIVNPPKAGEPSYELFVRERDGVLKDLNEKARLVAQSLNAIEGIQTNSVAGAMYAFPRITIPAKAIEAARQAGQQPDFFYAMRLLEQTGVCIVPGSGFGQRPGTFHFRTTILPSKQDMQHLLNKLSEFHANFVKEFQ